MTESHESLAAKDSEIANLQAEIARSRVSRETGMPVGLLATGRTAEGACAPGRIRNCPVDKLTTSRNRYLPALSGQA
jgi:hypothetical protein